MQKSIKIILVIILSTLISFTLFIIFSLLPTPFFQFFKDNKDVILPFISLLNFALVIVALLINWNKDINKERKERKEFWFRKMAAERKISDLIIFFDKSLDIVSEKSSLQDKIQSVSLRRRDIISEFVDLIRILDESLATTLDSYIFECEDIIKTCIEKTNSDIKRIDTFLSTAKSKLSKIKIEFLNSLYKFDESLK